MRGTNIIFITGTDTGAGKTLLTALLLQHLREAGHGALAIKPFCSGTRDDVYLLQRIQEQDLSVEAMNPWFFARPVAPRAELLAQRKDVKLAKVSAYIRSVARTCDWLLVEGSGGLMVPLGKGYTVLDLIVRLRCPVLVAGRNRLGCINHSLLTLSALQGSDIQNVSLVLMDTERPDPSCQNNQALIAKSSGGKPVFRIPYLGKQSFDAQHVVNSEVRLRGALDRIFSSLLR